MKKMIFACCVLMLFASCKDALEQDASVHLVLATQAYNKGAYQVARAEIDSIRLLYPKAIQTRKEAVELRLKVDLAEGQQAVEEADKIIQQKTELVERLQQKMVLEPQHGTVGNYVSPLQTVDKIAHNMLRAHVTEQGLLSLTSIYVGKIGHHAVKVTAQDGKTLQTTRSTAYFTSESHGKLLEEAVFSNDHEVGVCAFISEHRGQKIKITYLGTTEEKTVEMQAVDVQAITAVYDLYLQMEVLNNAKVRYADACEKVKFIHRKMEEKEGADD